MQQAARIADSMFLVREICRKKAQTHQTRLQVDPSSSGPKSLIYQWRVSRLDCKLVKPVLEQLELFIPFSVTVPVRNRNSDLLMKGQPAWLHACQTLNEKLELLIRCFLCAKSLTKSNRLIKPVCKLIHPAQVPNLWSINEGSSGLIASLSNQFLSSCNCSFHFFGNRSCQEPNLWPTDERSACLITWFSCKFIKQLKLLNAFVVHRSWICWRNLN